MIMTQSNTNPWARDGIRALDTIEIDAVSGAANPYGHTITEQIGMTLASFRACLLWAIGELFTPKC
jgi:hypothetical protein